MRLNRLNIAFQERGVTIVEYLIVFTVFGFILYFASLQFQPKTSSYFSQMTPGFSVDYPLGYTEMTS